VLESIYPASQARRLSALDGAHVNADINDHTENFAIAWLFFQLSRSCSPLRLAIASQLAERQLGYLPGSYFV
jgi:hypothetical protein